MLDQIGSSLGHAPAQARRAPGSTMTTEGHQFSLFALRTREQGEASAEQATIEVLLELAAHELRQRR